ncbi:MAG: DNA translocase FtsK, partial [Clostridia bacterium]
QKLIETLRSFGVEAKINEIVKGPAITRFEISPAPGIKVNKIVNLSNDIALNLAAVSVRVIAPIPGKAAVGIEIPNESVATVRLRDVIDSDEFRNFKSKTAFALGKDVSGKIRIADISKMPHLLIAGSTGSGKSVCINSLIASIIYKADPNEVKMIMIDPKVVELQVYNGIPHLLIPVVTDPRRAAGALNWAVQEMVKRYKLFAECNVRNLAGYNELAQVNGERKLEQIIIIVDELADLMMVSAKEVEDSICRLAQMARAAGMYLVIATQRPSVDVITGLIKANVPSRIAFAVANQIDSRTILDMGGAEKLLGKGDMLFLPMGANSPVRIQGAFATDAEIESIVEYIKQDFTAKYDEDVMEHIERGAESGSDRREDDEEADDMLPAAIQAVVEAGQASASLLQRRLKVGYARAGRLIDQLEERGIIGPQEGSKPRAVLMSRSEYLEMQAMGSDE